MYCGVKRKHIAAQSQVLPTHCYTESFKFEFSPNAISISISKFCRIFFITARKRSLGQGNIFIGVCQEFCSRGGYLGRYTPRARDTPLDQVHPPGPGTPRTSYPPWTKYPPDQVHLPWEQTPPPGREYWEIQSTHGRYASYWNAILLKNIFILNKD